MFEYELYKVNKHSDEIQKIYYNELGGDIKYTGTVGISDIEDDAGFWEFKLVAKQLDTIVGWIYCGNNFIGGQCIGVVTELYVCKNFRRKGIAKELIERAKKYYIGIGAKELRLECFSENTGGKEFYKKMGFKFFGIHREASFTLGDKEFFHLDLKNEENKI